MNKLREKLTKEVIGLLLSGATALLLLANLLSGTLAPEVKLKGTIGLDATHASTTQVSVAAGTVTQLRASTSCAVRVISTKVSPILLTFNGSDPTPLRGTLQPASTTTRYPSEEFGCGVIKALSADSAASQVTISDF